MKKIFNQISAWFSQNKENRRKIASDERIEEVAESIQLVTSNGKVYIAHRGVGVKELDETSIDRRPTSPQNERGRYQLCAL